MEVHSGDIRWRYTLEFIPHPCLAYLTYPVLPSELILTLSMATIALQPELTDQVVKQGGRKTSGLTCVLCTVVSSSSKSCTLKFLLNE